MRAPNEDEREPPHTAVDERPTSIVWWLTLGVAVCFLIGAIGYFVGVRVTQSSDSLSATDVGFLQDMIDHHDQAVELSLLELSDGSDTTARHFAQETIIFQRREIGIMETLLTDGGKARGEVPRDVMSWMNMTTPLGDMPGMASQDALDQLAAATGADTDRQFLELMRTHHQGGVHMADYEAQHGSNERVRALAARVAEYQRVEVNEYTMLMQKLGYA
jgi:uncharacterized protein (DUF305 family)